MITRRHIRIKVMQSLYSYFSYSKQSNVVEKEMIKNIDGVLDLYFLVISLILDLHAYGEGILADNKNKNFPDFKDSDELNFINNRLILAVRENHDIMKRIKKGSSILKNNDLDIVRKIFLKIYKSSQFASYLELEECCFLEDKKFIEFILRDVILDDEIFHHLLKENNIYWRDDLPFVGLFIMHTLHDLEESHCLPFFASVFKNIDDRKFTLELFRATISHNDEFDNLINKYAKNWDLERIANMDKLLIKMALSEICSFSQIPVNVSFNEYIEISKYYSTEGSKSFINGILDKIVHDFKKLDRFDKVGRGLI